MGTIIALDFGLKRTGIAMADSNLRIAMGYKTVDSVRLMEELKIIIPKEKVEIIVLGEPKRLDNSDTHITQNVYLLKEALEKAFPTIKITLYDERFTSKMAMNSLFEGGVSRKKRQDKALLDEVSATILLQSYLQANVR